MSTTPATTEETNQELDEEGRIRLMGPQDRCDRCGARAYIRATLSSTGSSEGELTFCAHHGREVEPTLRPKSTHWLDESHLLQI